MHKKFLLAALDQARQGQGCCAPNPAVGAVAVQNGTILAKSYHKGAGTLHAEPLVLAQIPPGTRGVSLYVSLEPCNHWGKTPPCVDAIIQHGIEEVIFAFADPNPIVAKNNSSEILHAQGIKTTYFPVEEITEFYKSYAHWTITHEPRVTVQITHSLNGKIGLSDGARIVPNSLCEQFTHTQRAITDIILITAETIQQGMGLTTKEQSKPLAILDPQLSLDSRATIFSTAKHCHIFHCMEQAEQNRSYPNSTLHWMPKSNQMVDLSEVIKKLGTLGFHDVWVEAGETLFSALHREALVHKTYLYMVPILLEQHAISAYQHTGIFNKAHTVSWQSMGDNMIACLDWPE